MAQTVKQTGLFFFPFLFTLVTQRYSFHLLLSPLRDGLLKFNLIPVRSSYKCLAYLLKDIEENERYFIKISTVHADVSIKSEPSLFLQASELRL